MTDRALEAARDRVRGLVRRDRWSTFAGVGLLAFGAVAGILPATGVGIGLVLVGHFSRRSLDRASTDVFALELARAADEPEATPLVVVPAGARDEPARGETPVFFRVALGAGLLAIVAILASFLPSSVRAQKQRWTFVDAATPADLGLSPRVATAGGWTLEEHPVATGGRAMVNHEGDPGSSPAILLVSGTRARDVRAMTRCKGESCGIAFRVVDERTYALARIDAPSRRVELVAVADGIERVIDAGSIGGAPEAWQELAVEARGDVVRVASNGRIVLETTSAEPAAVGGVGLWAPAASRAYFDELVVEPLPASPQALEVLPLLGRRST